MHFDVGIVSGPTLETIFIICFCLNMLIINGSLKLKKRHVVQIYFFESCAVFFNVHLSKLFRKMILENGFGHVCWLQITVS